MKRLTSQETAAIWKDYTKHKLPPRVIRKKYEVAESTLPYLIDKVRGYLSGRADLAKASPTYQGAIALIQAEEQITAEMLVTLYELRRTNTTAQVAAKMGWLDKGSTDRVYTILRILDAYLSPNIFPLLRRRKKPYLEARAILLNKYPQAARKHTLYLAHTDMETLTPLLGVFSEESPSEVTPLPPQPQPTLEDVFTQLIRKILAEQPPQSTNAIDTGTAVVTHPVRPSPPPPLPPRITDGDTHGYFLDDLKKTLPTDQFDAFIRWYSHTGRTGGVADGKIYVLEHDYQEWLLTNKA